MDNLLKLALIGSNNKLTTLLFKAAVDVYGKIKLGLNDKKINENGKIVQQAHNYKCLWEEIGLSFQNRACQQRRHRRLCLSLQPTTWKQRKAVKTKLIQKVGYVRVSDLDRSPVTNKGQHISIKPSLRFSNFGCCISKGPPLQII